MTGIAVHRHQRSRVSKEMRDQVFRTYGNICHLCWFEVGIGQRSADHLKSVRAGGSTILGNLRPAHKSCNEFRGARPLTAELRAEIRARYLQLCNGGYVR